MNKQEWKYFFAEMNNFHKILEKTKRYEYLLDKQWTWPGILPHSDIKCGGYMPPFLKKEKGEICGDQHITNSTP